MSAAVLLFDRCSATAFLLDSVVHHHEVTCIVSTRTGEVTAPGLQVQPMQTALSHSDCDEPSHACLAWPLQGKYCNGCAMLCRI